MYFGKIKGLSIFAYIRMISITVILIFLVSGRIGTNKDVIFLSICILLYVISDVVLLVMTKFSDWRDMNG